MQISGTPSVDTSERTCTGTYIYCILPAAAARASVSSPGTSSPGVQGEAPRLLLAGDLAAAVSDAYEAQYDIHYETILAHEAVVEDVMQHADVLPLRFGTVANSDREIQDLLYDRRSDLWEQLNRIHGCVEFGLKVLWKQEWLLARILAQDEAIRALRIALEGVEPHERFHERLQLGQLTVQAVERESARLAQHVMEEFEPLARATIVNPPLTEMMALNAAFLVSRDQVGAFEARERELAARGAGNLAIKLAGPLPPYNFVGIAIG